MESFGCYDCYLTLTVSACVSPQSAPESVGEQDRGATDDANTVLPGPKSQRGDAPQQQRLL